MNILLTDGVTYVRGSVVFFIFFASRGPTWTKYLLKAFVIACLSHVSLPLMLNLIGLESCGFPLPTISFIIFHDFGKFVLLNSNCSSMYSFSLFLRSEVNLLLNVVHSSLLSMVGFFPSSTRFYGPVHLRRYWSVPVSTGPYILGRPVKFSNFRI